MLRRLDQDCDPSADTWVAIFPLLLEEDPQVAKGVLVTIGEGPNAGHALGRVFLIFAILTVLTIPAIFRVPERRPYQRPKPAPVD